MSNVESVFAELQRQHREQRAQRNAAAAAAAAAAAGAGGTNGQQQPTAAAVQPAAVASTAPPPPPSSPADAFPSLHSPASYPPSAERLQQQPPPPLQRPQPFMAAGAAAGAASSQYATPMRVSYPAAPDAFHPQQAVHPMFDEQSQQSPPQPHAERGGSHLASPDPLAFPAAAYNPSSPFVNAAADDSRWRASVSNGAAGVAASRPSVVRSNATNAEVQRLRPSPTLSSSPMPIGVALAAADVRMQNAATWPSPMGVSDAAAGEDLAADSGSIPLASPANSMDQQFRQQMADGGGMQHGNGMPYHFNTRLWMCVYQRQTAEQIGVAYLNLDELVLLAGEFATIEGVQELKYRMNPGTIVTNFVSTEGLFYELQLNEFNPQYPFNVQHVKKSDFNFDASVQQLRSVHFDDLADTSANADNAAGIGDASGLHPSIQKRAQTMQLKSLLDVRQINMACAVGGLIRFLLMNGALQSELGSALHLNSLQSIVSDLLEVDGATRDALCIFVDDMHPASGRGGGSGNKLRDGVGRPGGGAVGSGGGGGGSKEGFSVFSVLNVTKTSGGGRMLKQWIRYPSANLGVIQSRQEHVKFFSAPANASLVGELRQKLRHIKDMARLCRKFRTKPAARTDWMAMKNSLEHMLAIHSTLAPLQLDPSSTLSLLHVMQNIDAQSLFDLRSAIVNTLDLTSDEDAKRKRKAAGETAEAPAAQSDAQKKKVLVRPGVSAKLDNLRELSFKMSSILEERTERDRIELARLAFGAATPSPLQAQVHLQPQPQSNYPDAAPHEVPSPSSSCFIPESLLDEYKLVYLPQISFHARLPVVVGITDPSIDIPGFEFKFRTEQHIFYKNSTAMELDKEFSDYDTDLAEEESNIVRDLQVYLCSLESNLKAVSELVAELDCILSLAVVAYELKLVCPTMVSDSSILIIHNGRHLLKEKKIQSFVDNDTLMRGALQSSGSGSGSESPVGATAAAARGPSPSHASPSPRRLSDSSSGNAQSGGEIHMITGPNNSGKSVYLKQVGIIVYLAHIGSFVPAESATIGLCDRILTRMTTVESSFSSLSSFMYDSTQVSFLLRHATKSSLLLIDEFGKGTGNVEGISLMAAIVRHLERLGVNCPKTFITTHFHELFQMGLIRESRIISFWRMDCVDQSLVDGMYSDSDDVRGISSASSSSSPAGFTDRFSARRQRADNRAGAAAKPPLPKITFLYKLVRGLARSSYGPSCAVAAGVDESLMMRAMQVSSQIVNRQSIVPTFDSEADASVNNGRAAAASAGAPAVPLNFSVDENDLWLDYLAFVLHRTSPTQPPPSSLAKVRESLSSASQAELEEGLTMVKHEVLQQLTEEFLAQNKERIQERLQVQQGEEGGAPLDSVD